MWRTLTLEFSDKWCSICIHKNRTKHRFKTNRASYLVSVKVLKRKQATDRFYHKEKFNDVLLTSCVKFEKDTTLIEECTGVKMTVQCVAAGCSFSWCWVRAKQRTTLKKKIKKKRQTWEFMKLKQSSILKRLTYAKIYSSISQICRGHSCWTIMCYTHIILSNLAFG